MSIENERTTSDEIVKEVRRIKEQLAESMDYDIDRMLHEATE